MGQILNLDLVILRLLNGLGPDYIWTVSKPNKWQSETLGQEPADGSQKGAELLFNLLFLELNCISVLMPCVLFMD